MTVAPVAPTVTAEDISIHMPHTWHDEGQRRVADEIGISIHMPHTWHDVSPARQMPREFDFNPHATYVA